MHDIVKDNDGVDNDIISMYADKMENKQVVTHR